MDSKKIILAAALAGLVAGTSSSAMADNHGGDKAKTEKGEKHKCADGSCGDKGKKGSKEKCADGSCGDKGKKGKKAGKEKCADGSCGDKH